MKKINFNEDQVNDIIQKYVEQGLSLVKIGEIYGVSKATIKLCLTNNNITIQLPGQRVKGGKSSADQRYYLKDADKIIAHQYKIRKTKEKEQSNTIGFNPAELSLKNTKIELIDRKVCKKIVEEYEWLGYMPRYTNYHFGIFFEINGEYNLGGVIAYQPEYGENLGVWDKFGYTNKIIQLSRGVCLWWTPKNTASYFINKTLDWLKTNTKYKVVTATVDSSAGEIGVIYQALNWIYVGLFGGNLTKSGKERIRYGYKIGDKIYNQRHIREKIGTAKNEIVLKHFPDVQIINLGRKKRYFQFIGTKLENKELIKAIQDIIKPYPKK